MQKFIVELADEDVALIDNDKLECFVVDSSLGQDLLKDFLINAQKNKKILLIKGDNACDVCATMEFDGVLIDLSKSEHLAKEINYIRKQIGDKVVGIISRNRRHEAMLISECEPDFVAFKAWQQGVEQTQELVSWYNEMFLLQSAVILEEPISDIHNFDCDIVVVKSDYYKNFCC